MGFLGSSCPELKAIPLIVCLCVCLCGILIYLLLQGSTYKLLSIGSRERHREEGREGETAVVRASFSGWEE